MNEKRNFDYKRLHPFKWYILENFPFLEDSIDVLTNYQLFCKLGEMYNKEIDAINTLEIQVEGITDWFDNLDVQEEVNKKLDEMAEDGTLADIINQEIFDQLNTKVNKSLILNENIADDTSLDDTFKNISIKTDYYANSTIYLIYLKNVESLALLATGNNTTAPEENIKNLIDYSKTTNAYTLYINAGVYNDTSLKPIGSCVFDGVPYNHSGSPDYYVGFDNNNMLKGNVASGVSSGNDLIGLGFKNACGTFAPVILNGNRFNVSGYSDSVYSAKHPRQLLIEDNDGNIIIMSVLGRTILNQGMTYDEIYNYLSDKNVKNAYNLDGGGSVQTVYNKSGLFESQDSLNIKGRSVPTAFGFKIGGIE